MALSNHWLLVPSAGSAVSASVGGEISRSSTVTAKHDEVEFGRLHPMVCLPSSKLICGQTSLVCGSACHLYTLAACMQGAEKKLLGAGAGRWAAQAAKCACILSVLQKR